MSTWGRFGIMMCLILSTQVWASIGKVSLLKGEASASRDQQNIALFSGATLEEHDVITTRANSQVQLTFEDKTVITLGSESVLDIKEYLNDAQEPKAKFKFTQGTFKSITGQIGKKAPDNFNLETRTATIGIRGTTVLGQIGSDGAASGVVHVPDTIGCSSGRIVVGNASGSVTLNAGFQTTVLVGQAPTPPVILSPSLLMSNHPASSGLRATHASSGTLPQPPIAGEASQTHQQTNTYTGFTNQIDNYSDSFYPVFSPTLHASSKNDGILTLSGFTTSSYISDATTLTSVSDTLAFNLDTAHNRITNSETTTSAITLDHTESEQISLAKASNSATMTYKDLNQFAIKNFNSQLGWMQTKNTYANDYVSWGYWAMKVNDDSKLLPTTNYWVAGKDVTAASSYIATLPATSYTYSGHVIGSVSDGVNSYTINPTTNNAVALNFDFGGGCGSLSSGSIQFQTSQGTPQVWSTTLLSTSVSGGSFTASEGNLLVNGATPSTSSNLVKGQFYGSSAQAVGGTFKLTADSQTATGVFKAVK